MVCKGFSEQCMVWVNPGKQHLVWGPALSNACPPPQLSLAMVSIHGTQLFVVTSLPHCICWPQDLANREGIPPAASRRVKIVPLVRCGHPTFSTQMEFYIQNLFSPSKTFLPLRNLGLDTKKLSTLSGAMNWNGGEFTGFDYYPSLAHLKLDPDHFFHVRPPSIAQIPFLIPSVFLASSHVFFATRTLHSSHTEVRVVL